MPRVKQPVPPKTSDGFAVWEVLWEDAEEIGDVGWNAIKELMREAAKPCPVMRTVGYLVYEGERHISLVSTLGPAECSRLEKIPRGFIQEINVLREARPTTRTSGKKKPNVPVSAHEVP